MKYPCNVLFENKESNWPHRSVGLERRWADQIRPLWALPDTEMTCMVDIMGNRGGKNRGKNVSERECVKERSYGSWLEVFENLQKWVTRGKSVGKSQRYFWDFQPISLEDGDTVQKVLVLGYYELVLNISSLCQMIHSKHIHFWLLWKSHMRLFITLRHFPY